MFDSNDRQTHYFKEVEKPGLLGDGVSSSEIIFVVVIVAALAIMHRMSRRNPYYPQSGYGMSTAAGGLARGGAPGLMLGLGRGREYDALMMEYDASMRRHREIPRGDDRRLLTSPLDRRRDEFRRFRRRLRDKRERHRREREVEKMAWAQRDGEEERRKQMQRNMRQLNPIDAASVLQLVFDRDLLVPTDVPTIYTLRDGFRHHNQINHNYSRRDPRYQLEAFAPRYGRSRYNNYTLEFDTDPRGYGPSIRLTVPA